MGEGRTIARTRRGACSEQVESEGDQSQGGEEENADIEDHQAAELDRRPQPGEPP
jgi:hypothetical protein